jgi:leader peptidase (prepilin peptidase) / N-methyltransferase
MNLDVFLYLVDWQRAICGATLGAIFGSFIGALVSRWPAGNSILSGRSACDSCGSQLRFGELIPVISFLVQNGCCRKCGSAIGRSQLFAEISAMAIGTLAFLILPPGIALRYALFGWLLLPLCILDYKHLWLPEKLIAILAIAGIGSGMLLTNGYDWRVQFVAALLCWAILEGVRRAYLLLRGVDGMGRGDPKLLAALALWTPPLDLPMLLLGASGLGLMYALIIRVRDANSNPKLPFGAFLGIAAIAINWPIRHF